MVLVPQNSLFSRGSRHNVSLELHGGSARLHSTSAPRARRRSNRYGKRYFLCGFRVHPAFFVHGKYQGDMSRPRPYSLGMLNSNLQATGPAIHAGDTHIPDDLPKLVHPVQYRRIQNHRLSPSVKGLGAKGPKVGAAARRNVPLTGEYGDTGLVHGKNFKSTVDVEVSSSLHTRTTQNREGRKQVRIPRF